MLSSLVKITDWEKSSIGRRLVCATGRALIFLAVVTAIAFILFANRYSIEAKVWHWRHGYSTTVGGYEIPVSDHWLVFSEDSASLTIANISRAQHRRDGKFHIAAVISVDVRLHRSGERPATVSRREFWVTFERQRLVSEKVESIEEKTLKFGDEPLTCIGGMELAALMRNKSGLPQTDIMSLDCMSESGLNVRFVGEPSDVQPFYTFVSQIRQRN